jgi:hypothetical protein
MAHEHSFATPGTCSVSVLWPSRVSGLVRYLWEKSICRVSAPGRVAARGCLVQYTTAVWS